MLRESCSTVSVSVSEIRVRFRSRFSAAGAERVSCCSLRRAPLESIGMRRWLEVMVNGVNAWRWDSGLEPSVGL